MSSAVIEHNSDSNESFACAEGSIVSSEVMSRDYAKILKNIPVKAPLVTIDEKDADIDDNHGDKKEEKDDKNQATTSDGRKSDPNVRNHLLSMLSTGWGDETETPMETEEADKPKVHPYFTIGGNAYAKRGIKDPLHKSTAFGLYDPTIDLRSKDNSPYPPPDANQQRFNCSFPAPKPIDEKDLPFYNRTEYFIQAQDWVEKDIKKSDEDKAWFESFIKEKIQFNVVDTNLDNIQFGTLRKGFAASQVIHTELGRLKEFMTCQLCEQIALNPKICATCTKIYCLSCVRWLQFLPGDLQLTKVTEADKFMCINSSCLVGIELNGYPKYTEVRNEEIRKLYSAATFTCHRQFCEAQLSVTQILYHLARCKNGPIVYEFDKTLQLNFISGPVREELNRKTVSLKSILPAHLKLKEPTRTHEQRWHKKALGYAFFSKNAKKHPEEFHPELIRAQTNFKSNYWNNLARQKDPTEPIDEAEQFALAIGFSSCSKVPIPDVKRRWPTTRCSRVPHYLLDYSLNWKRWYKYVDARDDDSLSTTSTDIMYAIDVEDTQSRFIRIDPYERLAPADAEIVQEWLMEAFPSCLNPRSIYKEPNTSTKENTIFHTVQRRGFLAQSFIRRPKANLPAMLDDQLEVVNDCAAEVADKQLIFSISTMNISVWENGRMRPRPCWVLIMDGNMQVIYETFVRYRDIEYIDSTWHGLSPKDLKYARNLFIVRDQVLKYLACASKIVGYGLINHLDNLGFTKDEIRLLHPKLRDVNNFYSPYIEHPMHLNVIAFLWFTGYTLPVKAHSPAVETTTVLRLYYLQHEEIERMAKTWNGIHNENVQQTCGNRVTAALLYEFDQGVQKGLCSWPTEWGTHPQRRRRIPFPVFSDNCVLPDKAMLVTVANRCNINLEVLKAQVAMSSQSPVARARRQAKAIAYCKKKESIAETVARFEQERKEERKLKRVAEMDNNPSSLKKSSGSMDASSLKVSESLESSNVSKKKVTFADSTMEPIPTDDEWK